MSLILVIISLLLAYFSCAETAVNDEQCCYMFGSVPRNASNCFPEGRQLNLNFVVINPRDNFTSLTVRWFRNADFMARSSSSTEEITDIPNAYQFYKDSISTARNAVLSENCTTGPLYKDAFILIIHNFTFEQNGYYWCEIVVNNSVSQPSQYAWFYAADNSTCRLQSHFIPANVAECAEFQYDYNTYPTSSSNSATMYSVTISEATTSVVEPNMSVLPYVTGFLSMFIILLISTVILLLLLYVGKIRRERRQKNGKSEVIERENATHNAPQVNTLNGTSNREIPLQITSSVVTWREEDIYSSVSDISTSVNLTSKSTDNKQDHTYDAAEFNKTEWKEQMQYNTLQHGDHDTVNTLTRAELCASLYNKIEENNKSKHHEINRSDLVSEEYDNVPGVRHQPAPSQKPLDTSRKQEDKAMYEMIPFDYEIPTDTEICSEKSDENKTFDDEMYSTRQQASQRAEQEMQKADVMAEPTVDEIYSEVANRECEYAEPHVSNRLQRPIQSQGICQDDEHLYHSLEENRTKNTDINSTHVSDMFQLSDSEHAEKTAQFYESSELTVSPSEKAIGGNEYHTQALPTPSYSRQSLDEVGATNSPILYNIEHCQFDDPMYDSGPQHSDDTAPQDKNIDIFDDPSYA